MHDFVILADRALASEAHAGRLSGPLKAISVSMIGADVPIIKSFPVNYRHFSTTLAFGHAVARQPTEPVRAPAQPDDAMTASVNNRPAAIRVVIPFVFRHWLNQPARAAGDGLIPRGLIETRTDEAAI